MKKLFFTLMLLSTMFLNTSCTDEQVEDFATIAALTYLFTATYSHNEYGTHYYKTSSCSSNYVYYGNGSRVYSSCRYYSAPSGYSSGYYITTSSYYSSFQVYR